MVPFLNPMTDPHQTALRLFGRPALAARKGCRRGGPGEGPLKGPFPGASAPLASACRRAADRLASAAWRHAPAWIRSRPRFRAAVLTRASRHANRAE